MTNLTRQLRPVVFLVAFVAALAVPGCKTTTGSGPGPTPVGVVNGVIDCAAPSLWKVVTFGTLVPILEHAVAQADPFAALNDLLTQYGEAEVACVAAYTHDRGTKQAIALPDSPVVQTRVSVTAEWLKRERGKGLTPSNFTGSAQ